MNSWHPYTGTKGVLVHAMIGVIVCGIVATVKDYSAFYFIMAGYAFMFGAATERYLKMRVA